MIGHKTPIKIGPSNLPTDHPHRKGPKMTAKIIVDPTTADSVPAIFKFFYENSMHFTIHNEDSIPTLIALIEAGKIQPQWCSPIIDLLDTIPQTSSNTIDEFINQVHDIHNLGSLEAYVKPTEHFKSYCGPEGLTPNGMTCKKYLLDFMDYQIKARGLKEENGVITTNEWLQGLILEYRSIIYRHEIPHIINRFIKK